MKSTAYLLFAFFLCSDTLADTFHHAKYKSAKQHQHIIPGRYMIEYQSNNYQQHQNTLLNTAESHQLEFGEPLYQSDRETNIRTVKVNKSNNQHDNSVLQTLVEDQNILAVYPVTYMSRPNALSNGYYSHIDPNVTSIIQAHHLTQVDRLHKELGLTGKGVKICVIDTGVDYNHPALGGGFGPGYKIQFGQDLVGNTFNPLATNNTLPPDGTPPLDNCGGLTEKSGKQSIYLYAF